MLVVAVSLVGLELSVACFVGVCVYVLLCCVCVLGFVVNWFCIVV